MPYTKLGGSGLKQSRQIPPAVGKAVGELKAIVCLDTLLSLIHISRSGRCLGARACLFGKQRADALRVLALAQLARGYDKAPV